MKMKKPLPKLPSTADLHEWKQWVVAFVLLSVTIVEGMRFILFNCHR